MFDGKVIIGIGGTIGSGKTTVSRIFEAMGAYYISADELGWDVLPAIASVLKERYGADIMKGNSINRKKLSERVFSDQKELEFLNSISHPVLFKYLKERIECAPKSLVVIDAALLFDWPEIMAIVDYPILVTANETVKEQRSIARGVDRKRFHSIRMNQRDDNRCQLKAKFTINNNGTIKSLQDRCRSILKEMQHGH